ncbi:retrotrans_gag domain-containing protein [Trichonephila clavipes]|nr:retrotrans_gag domain-containing protein [Trichonephila clavipes]
MREDEKVSHLMKGVAEDIYQALLTREINDTASFIKWCNYIEDMKQKRVGRPKFERLPNVVPKRSFKTKLKGFWPQCQQKPTETRPRPTYAAVTRKYRAPVQKFPPEPRKQMCGERLTTDLFVSLVDVLDMQCATAERERLSLTTLETADGTSTTLALKKKYADQTLLAVLRQVPREADPQYVVYRSPSPYRRSSQSPGRRSEENSRRATFQGGEAACTEILRRPPR